MVKDISNTGKTATDQEYVKQQLKAIKKAKKAGNERKAQRIADDLFLWLGWE